jgi:hypothetical protein
MVNSKILNKKQTVNLEYSYKWLRRAQNDLKAFKQLVPCDKDIHKIAHCKDPALSVYLLQQSVEKATKAVAAASGKYPYSKLKSHGHNSLAVLLDFYKRIILTIGNNPLAIELFSKVFGQDVTNGSAKIQAVLIESQKKPRDRKPGEKLYCQQFAAASASEIDNILNFLLKIRKEGFIGVLRSLFGPHGKIPINGKQLNTSTLKDLSIIFSAKLVHK